VSLSSDPPGARVARRLAEVAARLTYREIEVVSVGSPPAGPTVMVSNHFGGLADALLLVYLSERFTRIVARDVIWKAPGVGRFMRWIGAIPVHRRADSPDGAALGNDAMFATCYEALREGSVVLIFPEGVTQDDPYLAPVKTGAARIALGARASGVAGIQVQPVGIHYEDKAAFRSRVLVAFGAPIDVDDTALRLPDAGRGGADDRRSVDLLNDTIDASLRRAGPNFRDWTEAEQMQLAAEVTLRTVGGGAANTDDVPLSLREPLASALARLPESGRHRIQTAASQYRSTLQALRSTDTVLHAERTRSRLLAGVAIDVLIALLLLPYAVLGAVLGLVPYLLTQATALLRAAPAMRATILPLVALVVFMAEWVVLATVAASRDGWQTGVLVSLLVPAFMVATVVVAERAVQVWRGLRQWRTSARTAGPVGLAHHHRDELVQSVAAGLGGVAP
jgi:glycerol-3-phosphate O-acyltransferase / dihydroxyacetone phosphate acyltransferase